MWLILSAIPVMILLIFNKHLPFNLKLVLKLCCIPFICLIAIYSLILGAALMIALILFIKYQEYKIKKNPPSSSITYKIIEHDDQ